MNVYTLYFPFATTSDKSRIKSILRFTSTGGGTNYSWLYKIISIFKTKQIINNGIIVS